MQRLSGTANCELALNGPMSGPICQRDTTKHHSRNNGERTKSLRASYPRRDVPIGHCGYQAAPDHLQREADPGSLSVLRACWVSAIHHSLQVACDAHYSNHDVPRHIFTLLSHVCPPSYSRYGLSACYSSSRLCIATATARLRPCQWSISRLVPAITLDVLTSRFVAKEDLLRCRRTLKLVVDLYQVSAGEWANPHLKSQLRQSKSGGRTFEQRAKFQDVHAPPTTS